MNKVHVQIPVERIRDFCRKWKVKELSLFGSVLHDGFRRDSDVDVLVEFSDDAPWDLWDLAAMQTELAAIFGRDVDLVEKQGLRNPFRRRSILNAREIVYAG
jgi:hypothetical protein